ILEVCPPVTLVRLDLSTSFYRIFLLFTYQKEDDRVDVTRYSRYVLGIYEKDDQKGRNNERK
ncbi:hypothetical protein ACFLTX_02845, partial [Chloroflexota bacterium]